MNEGKLGVFTKDDVDLFYLFQHIGNCKIVLVSKSVRGLVSAPEVRGIKTHREFLIA